MIASVALDYYAADWTPEEIHDLLGRDMDGEALVTTAATAACREHRRSACCRKVCWLRARAREARGWTQSCHDAGLATITVRQIWRPQSAPAIAGHRRPAGC